MSLVTNIKSRFNNNSKNLLGWTTKRKILAFSVDDYGNVRVDSPKALERITSRGLKIQSRFDRFDSLETKEDLEVLFEALTSVKDINGRHAVFTPFALPSNLDFENMAASNYEVPAFELLTETFKKLPQCNGSWEMWKEGMKKGIFLPQSHGREHLNIKVLTDKLRRKDPELLTVLKNRSYCCISSSGYPTISYTAAFDFWNPVELQEFDLVLQAGVHAFEEVFGYKPVHFTPPGGREHRSLHFALRQCGIRYIDSPSLKKEHEGYGRYRTVINYMGKSNSQGQIFLIRNGVFEPSNNQSIDWVAYTLKQIEAAFRWNKPAVISSHRVNFCGLLDERNRQNGINDLRRLLKKVVARWPDIEFMSSNEIGDLIQRERN